VFCRRSDRRGRRDHIRHSPPAVACSRPALDEPEEAAREPKSVRTHGPRAYQQVVMGKEQR
jgi:hypothetical protein